MFRSLYFRMGVVHYAGIILLPLSAFFLTDNLYAQILQIIVAVVIVIHEIDENINGRKLSKNLEKRLNQIGTDEKKVSINTSMSSEYDEFMRIIQHLEAEDKSHHEEEEFIKRAKSTIERVKKGWYSETITATIDNPLLNEFKNDVNDMIISTKKHFEDVNKILEQYAHLDYRNELKLNNVEKGGVFELLVTDINK